MADLVEFLASFKDALARPNRFDVILNTPAGILAAGSSNRERFTFRCESAELPGRSLMTHDQKTYGPIEKYPYQNAYNDINLTFIVDEDMHQRIFFDMWLNFISSTNDFNFKYKIDYCTDLYVFQYNTKNEITYGVRLIDAFPIAVNQMDLDWSVDAYHKLTVVFAYTSYEVLDSSVLNGSSDIASLLSVVNSSTTYGSSQNNVLQPENGNLGLLQQL